MNNKLHSNEELFVYLQFLANEFKKKGNTDLANELFLASNFISGSASEFLHEAHVVLIKVLSNYHAYLLPDQISELKSVIIQIEKAFREIGGA